VKIDNEKERIMKKVALTHAYETELYVAKNLIVAGDLDSAFKRIETAHVLGQRHVLRHVQVHCLMLLIGYKRNSVREMSGQLLRIIFGALGSCISIVPIGNTGGTNVGMFQPMSIAPELKKLLG
jgi:hypothetical protein